MLIHVKTIRVIALDGTFSIRYLPHAALVTMELAITEPWTAPVVSDDDLVSFHTQLQAVSFSDKALRCADAAREITPRSPCITTLRRRILSFFEFLLKQETLRLGSCCEAVAITIL